MPSNEEVANVAGFSEPQALASGFQFTRQLGKTRRYRVRFTNTRSEWHTFPKPFIMKQYYDRFGLSTTTNGIEK